MLKQEDGCSPTELQTHGFATWVANLTPCFCVIKDPVMMMTLCWHICAGRTRPYMHRRSVRFKLVNAH